MTLKSFVEFCGWAAAALILGGYSLLSFGAKIQARAPLYQWMEHQRSPWVHHQLHGERRMAVGGTQCSVAGHRGVCAAAQ